MRLSLSTTKLTSQNPNLITEVKNTPKSSSKFLLQSKERVRKNLVKIWSNLSLSAQKDFVNRKIDEDELIKDSNKEMNRLMASYPLKDTKFFDDGLNSIKKNSKNTILDLHSKKIVNTLKETFKENAKNKRINFKHNRQKQLFVKEKISRINRIRADNYLHHRSTYNHHLDLLNQLACDVPLKASPTPLNKHSKNVASLPLLPRPMY